jgi:hypothetical protein
MTLYHYGKEKMTFFANWHDCFMYIKGRGIGKRPVTQEDEKSRDNFLAKFSGPLHDEASGSKISVNVSIGTWLGFGNRWIASEMCNLWIGGMLPILSSENYKNIFFSLFKEQNLQHSNMFLLQLPWRIVFTNSTDPTKMYFHKVYAVGERGFYLSSFFPDSSWIWPAHARLAEFFRECLGDMIQTLDSSSFVGNGMLATRVVQNTPGMLDYYNTNMGDSLDSLGQEVKQIVLEERTLRKEIENRWTLGGGSENNRWIKHEWSESQWTFYSTLGSHRGVIFCEGGKCGAPAYLGCVEIRPKNRFICWKCGLKFLSTREVQILCSSV